MIEDAIACNEPPDAGTPAGQSLRHRTTLDLVERVQSGIFVYPALWALIGFGSGLHRIEPVFVGANALFFVVIALARRSVMRRLCALTLEASQPTERTHRALVLANGAQWGLLTALSLFWPPLIECQMPLLIAAVGITAAGSVVMAIDRPLARWFTLLVTAPPSLALIADPTPLHRLELLCLIVFLIYATRVSTLVHKDYWGRLFALEQLAEHARQLQIVSVTDALTGLHNRLHFETQWVAAWGRAYRQQRSLALLLVDLDHFKQINDRYGHPAGDRCLRAAADVLRQAIQRQGDVAARYGGEEFAIVLADTDLDGAAAVARRILQSMRDCVPLPECSPAVRLTCSIGIVALVPVDLDSTASTIALADNALYRAKQQGRDRLMPALTAPGGGAWFKAA